MKELGYLVYLYILIVVIRLLFNNFIPRYSFGDSTSSEYRIISKESIFKGKHLFRGWMFSNCWLFEFLDSLPIECFPLTYDLSDFKFRINRHLLTVGSF